MNIHLMKPFDLVFFDGTITLRNFTVSVRYIFPCQSPNEPNDVKNMTTKTTKHIPTKTLKI